MAKKVSLDPRLLNLEFENIPPKYLVILKKKKNSLILYFEDFKHTASFSMEERGQLYEALFRYEMEDIMPTDLSPHQMVAFRYMKDKCDRRFQKYALISYRRHLNTTIQWENAKKAEEAENGLASLFK